MLGPILVGHYRTPARRVVRTEMEVRRSEVDHWVLRVATKGVLVSSGSFGKFRALPGQVAIGSFAQSYSDDYSAGEWIAAMIPRAVLPAPGAAALGGRPGVLSGTTAGLLGDFLASLVRRLPHADPSEFPVIAETTRAMIAACLEGRERSVTDPPVEKSVMVLAHLDRIIRENLASARLNPTRICALAGISRSTLYRLFEARGGVAAYIQTLRLNSVHAQLSHPRLARNTIASLASGQGMHNAAAFNRAFRQHFGCTPGEVRAAALRGEALPSHRAAGNQAQSFADLLR